MPDEILKFSDFSYAKNGRIIFDDLTLSLIVGEIHAVMSGRAYDLSNFSDLIICAVDVDA